MVQQEQRYKTVLLVGAPGAGKGTQGKILGRIPGFFHLACGDIFRMLDMATPEGRKVWEYSSRGELAPDDVTIEIWSNNIHAQATIGAYKPRTDLLILDGIPRNRSQAELMDTRIEVLEVIHLVCRDRDKMIDRLRRRALKDNRHDDAREDVIVRRWEIYEEETKPIIEHYPPSIVHEVDAIASPAAVLQHVLERVVPVQNRHFSNALDP